MSKPLSLPASRPQAAPHGAAGAPAAPDPSRARWGFPPPAWLLGLLLLLSALLSAGFARATPVGAAPDEAAHVEYVRVLAMEGRLPRLNLAEHRSSLRDINYEAHQSPLYYTLAVPFYRIGRACGGAEGAAQGCRVLSILLGLLGIGAIWLLARELAPDRPALWAAAAGFAAFLPMRLHVNASVSNDPLTELTCTLSLLLMLRALRGPWRVREALYLGLALGAALLAKQSNLMLFPAALVAVFLASRSGGAVPPADGPAESDLTADGVRRFLRTGGVVLGAALLVSGWWFIRNGIIYGDPLAQKAFDWYFSDTTTFAQFRAWGFSFAEYLSRKVLPTTFDTFWGAFGYLSPTRPDLFLGAYGSGAPGSRWGYPPQSWLYPWLWIAVEAALLGGLLFRLRLALQRRTASAEARPGAGEDSTPAAILAIHGLFVLSAFLRFNTTYFQAQGRYLFPAIGFLSLTLAGGWLEWPLMGSALAGWALARHGGERSIRAPAARWEWAAAVLILGGMLALALYALFGVAEPGFRVRSPAG